MTDEEFARRAELILHRLALEHTGWRRYIQRWWISDEPLRNDAANLLIQAGRDRMRPEDTKYAGED